MSHGLVSDFWSEQEKFCANCGIEVPQGGWPRGKCTCGDRCYRAERELHCLECDALVPKGVPLYSTGPDAIGERRIFKCPFCQSTEYYDPEIHSRELIALQDKLCETDSKRWVAPYPPVKISLQLAKESRRIQIDMCCAGADFQNPTWGIAKDTWCLVRDSPWNAELEFVLRIVVACFHFKPGNLFPHIVQPVQTTERYGPAVVAAQQLRDAVIRTGTVPKHLDFLRNDLWVHRHRSAFYAVGPSVVEAYPSAYQECAA